MASFKKIRIRTVEKKANYRRQILWERKFSNPQFKSHRTISMTPLRAIVLKESMFNPFYVFVSFEIFALLALLAVWFNLGSAISFVALHHHVTPEALEILLPRSVHHIVPQPQPTHDVVSFADNQAPVSTAPGLTLSSSKNAPTTRNDCIGHRVSTLSNNSTLAIRMASHGRLALTSHHGETAADLKLFRQRRAGLAMSAVRISEYLYLMPFTNIAGHPLHYQIFGRGFPLLLGHSYLWDSHMWAPQIEALAAHYQVIVPDLWGHGKSGNLPPGTSSLGDLAEHFSEFLDALGVERCALVGLSVGGMWGSLLALAEPERIRALVLMDTDLGAEPDESHNRYFRMLNTIEALGVIPPPMLDAIAPLFFRPNVAVDSMLVTTFRDSLSRFSASQLRDSVVPIGRIIFGRPEVTFRLANLDPTRTLLMCGSCDTARPPSETVRMAKVIGCEHVLIPDAGHISNLENAQFVTTTLLRWLDSQGLVASAAE